MGVARSGLWAPDVYVYFLNKTYRFRGDLAVIYLLLSLFFGGGGGRRERITASTNLKGLYAFFVDSSYSLAG